MRNDEGVLALLSDFSALAFPGPAQVAYWNSCPGLGLRPFTPEGSLRPSSHYRHVLNRPFSIVALVTQHILYVIQFGLHGLFHNVAVVRHDYEFYRNQKHR
jgi:hypothetical protein